MVTMTTTATFDPAAHPRVASGQFTDKRNDAPTGELAEAADESVSVDLFETDYDGVTYQIVHEEGTTFSAYRDGMFVINFHAIEDLDDHESIDDAFILAMGDRDTAPPAVDPAVVAAFEKPRPEDDNLAQAMLTVDIRNNAFPRKMTFDEAAALIDPEKLAHTAQRIARDAAPERMFLAGQPHPYDEHLDTIWRGEATGFGETYARKQIAELRALREGLVAGTVRPRDVIGTGYKGDTRKMANEYLDKQQATYERALQVRGRNLSVNVANARYHDRKQQTPEAG